MAARTLTARVGDDAYTVRVDGRTVSVAPARAETATVVETQYLGHGRVLLRVDGTAHPAWVVEDGDTRWVFVDGRVTTVEVTTGTTRGARRASPDSHPALHAPMPATVIRVVAPPGTRVARGATIVLLEAMKMELPLRAPHDAVVTAVHCREGDLVQPNVVLVELGGGASGDLKTGNPIAARGGCLR